MSKKWSLGCFANSFVMTTWHRGNGSPLIGDWMGLLDRKKYQQQYILQGKLELGGTVLDSVLRGEQASQADLRVHFVLQLKLYHHLPR